MREYIVNVVEKIEYALTVEADSPEEAVRKVEKGVDGVGVDAFPNDIMEESLDVIGVDRSGE